MQAYRCSNLTPLKKDSVGRRSVDPDGYHFFTTHTAGTYKIETIGDVVVYGYAVQDELHFCSQECLIEWASKWSKPGLREL